MERKIVLTYKKNGNFNQAVLTIDKKILKALNLLEDETTIYLNYSNYKIILKRRDNKRVEKTIIDKDGKLKELSKNINLNVSHSNKEKGYFNYKLTIPGLIVKAMELDKDPNIDIRTEGDKIIITSLKYRDYRNYIVEESEETIFREEISEYNQGGKMKNIFTVKVNKGGIGKTFFTVQIGHGLALQGYKVLLITSDSQNNILHYTKSKKEIDKYDLSKGLRHAVLYGDNRDLYIKVRENLYFLPTESSVFSDAFEKKFDNFIRKKRIEYDYILIDSIPTMDIDKKFMECSDQLIIPTFCDYSTYEGTLNVIEEVGANKIHSIIINLFKNTKIQKKYYSEFEKSLSGTGIVFPKPIKELSLIENLIENGKTIWESGSKLLIDVQNSFADVIAKIIRNE
ncbi:Sporulation initiation inhibitor protein soj [Fusobacterium polymorphum]|nr:ParA family protein [Fusobacterium polymorphum]WRL69208.1 ParA family protein [Fusobacterium polymorphum]CKH05362.1 Sporulation initiation inhibitor protein soj [Fusobacterium polymorphum]